MPKMVLVAGANVTCMFVQLFKLLSAEGVGQLASRSARKINTIILPLKKRPRPYMIQCQWCQLPVESSKWPIFGTLVENLA